MKKLTNNNRTLLCALTDIEMVLDNVELSVPQVEKIWGSIKVIRDVVNEETITGVITAPVYKPRTIGDIYYELSNHPDFVAGSYYTKNDVIDTIICTISDDYEDEDGILPIVILDSEQIYENNSKTIFNNINGCYEYAFQDIDILEGCDLTIEKQIK